MASAQSQTPATRALVAGYAGKASGNLTTVTAEVLIPTVTCQPRLPLGQDLQIGVPLNGEVPASAFISFPLTVVLFTDVYCAQGSSSPVYSAYFYLVLHATLLFEHRLPLKFSAGDSIAYSVTINRATDNVKVSLNDRSNGAHVSYSQHVPGASYLTGVGWEVGPCEEATCHSIISNQLDLARFSTITISKATFSTNGCRAMPLSKLSSLSRLILVDGNNKIMAKPSPLITDKSFKVTFVAST